MIGTNRQDGLGADCHKQPPESQCLRATTQKHNLFLYVQFGSVGRLSCLSSGTYMTGQLVPSCNTASQHGREYWAAHTRFFKFLPQRDIHHFHPDSIRVAGKYSGTVCLDGERNPGIVSSGTDSTMGKEVLRISEHSSPVSHRVRVSGRGTARIQAMTPEAPMPTWKCIAPNQSSLLQ